jgi:hypothetical protein
VGAGAHAFCFFCGSLLETWPRMSTSSQFLTTATSRCEKIYRIDALAQLSTISLLHKTCAADRSCIIISYPGNDRLFLVCDPAERLEHTWKVKVQR